MYCIMILQYFLPSLSYHLSSRPIVLSIFEWPLKTGFTVAYKYIQQVKVIIKAEQAVINKKFKIMTLGYINMNSLIRY